ncbi:amidohydrolase family protein [Pseudenhygromyxa sp. WMMC2535]|uniref:N-acyl-D-amino-acid deacylase family protein n=1 Tax=Pseudenhygromyxa sp. WMMC2535 TaxID=2712867 RepID=UPI0015518122|nr:amidohydrolase family protein [Pseudenhygromyxa sp. WMMC2535]NVB38149.1 amidohydrolase family protein [Pseudenhygromyxa sp. WMMC2535]
MSEQRFDLVIRNGTVIDGTGAPRRQADVGVRDGKIVAVEPGLPPGSGAKEIDATGKLVTPGFVDVHTHYDAQVTWDPQVTPSSWHGVTTVVMGNCGVGFAPAAPDKHDWLIGLMEGVEDIPGTAMTEGMVWDWESFPDYLDAIDKQARAIDICAQVPHGALRAYVMGRRGAKHEAATADDLAAMARIVREGVEAGALGFSTSRTPIHKGIDGEFVPGTFADERENFALAKAVVDGGGVMFQMTGNHVDMAEEYPWMRRMVEEIGCTVSFNLLQTDQAPKLYEKLLTELDAAERDQLPIYAQVAGRPNGVLMTWAGTAVPFLPYPSYMPLHHLPFEQRLVELRKPGLREKVIAEKPFSFGEFEDYIIQSFHKMYRLGDPPNYEPDPSETATAVAARTGSTPQAVVWDWLMEDEGRGVVYFPIFNFASEDFSDLRTLLQHPRTRLGLGDGGAHCGAICDASIQTFMLTHWCRDRSRGPKLGLEEVVKTLSSDTASFYGLDDRGRVAPGYKADLNVIDFDALHLHGPKMVYDLPAGGRRFVQRAEGFVHTIVSGEIIRSHDEPTEALPGKLVRGPQPAPA